MLFNQDIVLSHYFKMKIHIRLSKSREYTELQAARENILSRFVHRLYNFSLKSVIVQ